MSGNTVTNPKFNTLKSISVENDQVIIVLYSRWGYSTRRINVGVAVFAAFICDRNKVDSWTLPSRYAPEKLTALPPGGDVYEVTEGDVIAFYNQKIHE